MRTILGTFVKRLEYHIQCINVQDGIIKHPRVKISYFPYSLAYQGNDYIIAFVSAI